VRVTGPLLPRLTGLTVAAVLVLAGCGTVPRSATSPTRSTSPRTSSGAGPAPSPRPRASRTPGRAAATPSLGSWQVGASPLPLRPDGLGKVLPTPPRLRDRRLPTRDVLPPPRDGAFHATVSPIPASVRRRMGRTWEPGCPVPVSGLRYLTLTFRGFDGRPHTGELVVNASVAADVVSVFRRLYAASYPIEEMRLPTTADLEAPPTGDGNDTAAFVCRLTRGSTTLSAHAYGLAIDVNPFMNPYHRVGGGPDLVLPELASAYLDRSWHRPGMILPGGVVTRAFARVGWTWGGDFHSVSDLMHFSADGR
jgi:hypothetical protein